MVVAVCRLVEALDDVLPELPRERGRWHIAPQYVQSPMTLKVLAVHRIYMIAIDFTTLHQHSVKVPLHELGITFFSTIAQTIPFVVWGTIHSTVDDCRKLVTLK